MCFIPSFLLCGYTLSVSPILDGLVILISMVYCSLMSDMTGGNLVCILSGNRPAVIVSPACAVSCLCESQHFGSVDNMLLAKIGF